MLLALIVILVVYALPFWIIAMMGDRLGWTRRRVRHARIVYGCAISTFLYWRQGWPLVKLPLFLVILAVGGWLADTFYVGLVFRFSGLRLAVVGGIGGLFALTGSLSWAYGFKMMYKRR